MDPLSLLAIFGPLAVDLGKSLIGKFVNNGEFKPATVDDFLKIRENDLAMFKAMNEAGGTNQSFPWVEAIIRLMRPAIGIIVLSVWAYDRVGPNTGAADSFAAAIGFYLFGDRTLFYSRRAK